MPSNSHSTRALKKSNLLLHLTSAIACISTTPALAQLNSDPLPTLNYVDGNGLSPSYFLPPTNIPLTPAPLPPLPSNSSPAIVGSGINNPRIPTTPEQSEPGPLNPPQLWTPNNLEISPHAFSYQENAAQIPTPETTGQWPTPLAPQSNNSVDLDLRSPIYSNPHQNCTPSSSRPLACPSPWFFSANALFLKINENQNRVLSTTTDPTVAQLTTNALGTPSTGGYELGLGRYFGNGKYAFNASYWGFSPSASNATVNGLTSGSLVTDIPFNSPALGNPSSLEGLFVGDSSMSELFNSATLHRIESQRSINNLEMNLYWFAIGGAARQPLPPTYTDSRCWNLSQHPTSPVAPWFETPSRLRLSLFSGVRWFQFDDSLNYSALDAYYQNHVQNNLWGIQSGALSHFSVTQRWSLWSKISAGVFNNRTLLETSAGNASQLATISSVGAAKGTLYDFESSGNRSSLLGETDIGVGWHFARGWSANLGYRVLGVTDLAKAPNQIPLNFNLPIQSSSIQANESLFLHGATLGATYNF